MDDKQIGRRVRAVRQHLGLRQADVAARAGVSRYVVLRLERGDLARVPLPATREVIRALDMELDLITRWRGGQLDRLIDEGNVTLGEAVIRRLEALGWILQPEVSFSIYGDRGSIDLLAWHPAARTLLVIEIKTSLNSVEETLRVLDMKVRHAADIAEARFGWKAAVTAFMLVLPDESTARRRVARHETVFGRAFPKRGDEARAWLRSPSGPAGILLFQSDVHQPNLRRHALARKRIRPRRPQPSRPNGAPGRTNDGKTVGAGRSIPQTLP